MRRALIATLLLAPFASAQEAEEGVIKNEEANFEIRLPKFSVDWTIETVSEEKKAEGARCHLRTVFADTEPEASCDVWIYQYALHKDQIRKSLANLAKWWGSTVEAHLANPRERKEEAGKFGEVEYQKVDVQGDYLAGIHQRTWYLTRNGKSTYLIIIDRNYRGVGDEDLEEEVQQIVGTFRFLTVEKIEVDKKANPKGGVPNVGGQRGGTKAGAAIDPELLKKETFKEPFWRFSVVKPEGLVKKDLTSDDKKADLKYWFAADKDQSRLWLRVYAQTEKAKKWTLEQLRDHKLGYWKSEVKDSKEPKIDMKAKFSMAKDAIRIDLVGRRTTNVYRTYILMDCKNDRQYQLEIFFNGAQGKQLWGKTVEEFLKNFKPFKK